MKNKKWSIPFLTAHKDIALFNDDYDNENLKGFINHPILYLEIGTGKGDFILNMSRNNLHAHFLGIEKSVTCLAITAKKVFEENITNTLLIADDICNVIDFLPNNSVDTIFLNFSDPWPKKRHQKRRLTYKTFLDMYRKVLKKDGKIIMKTDNLDLFEFSLESFKENNYILLNVDYDYDGSDEFDTPTEYETYFRNEGTPIKRLIAKVGQENEIK